MNDPKGQSLVGIIIVFTIVGLVIGGLYYYFSKQIPKIPEVSEQMFKKETIKPEEVTPSIEEEKNYFLKEITRNLLVDFFEWFRSPTIAPIVRLETYRIDEIKVEEIKDNYFGAIVKYSIKTPIKSDYWKTGSWAYNKELFADIAKEEEKYKIRELVTAKSAASYWGVTSWKTYQDKEYRFELKYPEDGEVVESQFRDTIRINLPFILGTTLYEKYLIIKVKESTPEECFNPMQTIIEKSEIVYFNDIEFKKETGKEGTAGSSYETISYSTMKETYCISLSFILRSISQGVFYGFDIPPDLNREKESKIFEEIMSTFRFIGPIVQKCADGTLDGQCSVNKPKYCKAGKLIEKCSICGCPLGQQCQTNESCIVSLRGSVAIFIDKNTYNQLSNRINRFKSDIQNDLDVNVFLHYDNWKNANQIRNIIIDHYQNDELLGSILIGDIPTSYFEGSYYAHPYDYFASDYYYMDLDNKFQDEDNDGRFEDLTYQWTDTTMPEVWCGRIKPPTGGQEGTSLLRDYFDRNHNYRTGKILYPQKTLYIDSTEISELNYSKSKYINKAKERNHLLYQPSQIDALYLKDPKLLKKEYLSKLKKNHYETVYTCLHGSFTSQFFGIGNGVSISFNDIKNVKPSALFVQLTSCSNGNFEENNYMGGWYLFGGEALVVKAVTLPAFFAPFMTFKSLTQLRLGITFGEELINSGDFSCTVLLGDPTLKLREEPSKPQPSSRLSSYEIDFGKVGVGKQTKKEITFFNDGNVTLKIKYGTGAISLNGKSYIGEVAINPGGPYDGAYFAIIKPNSLKQFSYNFKSLSKGVYTSTDILYTNDPDHPYIKIKLKGIGI